MYGTARRSLRGRRFTNDLESAAEGSAALQKSNARVHVVERAEGREMKIEIAFVLYVDALHFALNERTLARSETIDPWLMN